MSIRCVVEGCQFATDPVLPPAVRRGNLRSKGRNHPLLKFIFKRGSNAEDTFALAADPQVHAPDFPSRRPHKEVGHRNQGTMPKNGSRASWRPCSPERWRGGANPVIPRCCRWRRTSYIGGCLYDGCLVGVVGDDACLVFIYVGDIVDFQNSAVFGWFFSSPSCILEPFLSVPPGECEMGVLLIFSSAHTRGNSLFLFFNTFRRVVAADAKAWTCRAPRSHF